MIGTNAKTVSTDATLTGNGTSGSPLSVAAPGLSAVSTDTTLTGSGTVGSPLSVADPSAGGSKLMRVDTGAWELAQNGVEYESPDQSASGIFSAMVKRKYIAAGTSSGTVIAAGTTALVNCNAVVDGGFYHRAAGSARLPRSFPDHVDICRKESSGDIELILGGTGQSVLNGSWVDYI